MHAVFGVYLLTWWTTSFLQYESVCVCSEVATFVKFSITLTCAQCCTVYTTHIDSWHKLHNCALIRPCERILFVDILLPAVGWRQTEGLFTHSPAVCDLPEFQITPPPCTFNPFHQNQRRDLIMWPFFSSLCSSLKACGNLVSYILLWWFFLNRSKKKKK